MLAATRKWERIALKWRALAERRCEHFHALYSSGRWRRYYTEEEFLAELRHTVTLAERWAKIAPIAEEREASAEQPAKAA